MRFKLLRAKGGLDEAALAYPGVAVVEDQAIAVPLTQDLLETARFMEGSSARDEGLVDVIRVRELEDGDVGDGVMDAIAMITSDLGAKAEDVVGHATEVAEAEEAARGARRRSGR
jgi:hypothetical protein